MKLNNKGYMLVEIVLASVIAMVVAYLLIDITFKLMDKNNDYYMENLLVADKSIVTKTIMDDIYDNNLLLTKIEKKSSTNVAFTFKNLTTSASTTKDLTISGNAISYGSYQKVMQDELNIGSINITNDSANKFLYINVPAYTNYSEENYGIKLVISYQNNSEVSIVIPDSTTTPETETPPPVTAVDGVCDSNHDGIIDSDEPVMGTTMHNGNGIKVVQKSTPSPSPTTDCYYSEGTTHYYFRYKLSDKIFVTRDGITRNIKDALNCNLVTMAELKEIGFTPLVDDGTNCASTF